MKKLLGAIIILILLAGLVMSYTYVEAQYIPSKEEVKVRINYTPKGVVLTIIFKFKVPGKYSCLVNSVVISNQSIVVDLSLEKGEGKKRQLVLPVLLGEVPAGKYELTLNINDATVLKEKIEVRKFEHRREIAGFQIYDTGVISIAIPIRPSFPFYIWWYNYDNSTVYVGRYYGIAEVWLWPGYKFRSKFLFNESKDLAEQIAVRLSTAVDIESVHSDLSELVELIEKSELSKAKDVIDDIISELSRYNKSENVRNIISKLEKIEMIIENISQVDLLKYKAELQDLTNEIKKVFIANVTDIFSSVFQDIFMDVLSLNDTIAKIISGSGSLEDLVEDAQNKINEIIVELNTVIIVDDEQIIKHKESIIDLLVSINNTLTKLLHASAAEKPRLIAKLVKDSKELLSKAKDYMMGLMVSWAQELTARFRDLIAEVDNIARGSGNISIVLEDIETCYRALEKINTTLDSLSEILNLTKTYLLNIKTTLLNISDYLDKLYELNGLINEIKDTLQEIAHNISQKIKMYIVKIVKFIRYAHPFHIPFAMLKWMLEPPENITDDTGNVIGVQFTFVSEGFKGRFKEMFGLSDFRIVIRNRMYFVPVNETIGNQTYTITRAELKNDIIISGYKWNYDLLKEYMNVTKLNITPRLVLFAQFNTLPAKVGFSEEIVNKTGAPLKVKVGTEEVKVHKGVFYEDDIQKFEVNIMSENGTVWGFYRFQPKAIVHYENHDEIIEVKGVFLLTERLLTVFLVYPYFDGGVLEHDPLFGVVVEETEESPIYSVSISGGEISSVEATEISANIQSVTIQTGVPATEETPLGEGVEEERLLMSKEMIMILAGVIIVVIIVVALALRRGR